MVLHSHNAKRPKRLLIPSEANCCLVYHVKAEPQLSRVRNHPSSAVPNNGRDGYQMLQPSAEMHY
jgi:hypothetical protein